MQGGGEKGNIPSKCVRARRFSRRVCVCALWCSLPPPPPPPPLFSPHPTPPHPALQSSFLFLPLFFQTPGSSKKAGDERPPLIFAPWNLRLIRDTSPNAQRCLARLHFVLPSLPSRASHTVTFPSRLCLGGGGDLEDVLEEEGIPSTTSPSTSSAPANSNSSE